MLKLCCVYAVLPCLLAVTLLWSLAGPEFEMAYLSTRPDRSDSTSDCSSKAQEHRLLRCVQLLLLLLLLQGQGLCLQHALPQHAWRVGLHAGSNHQQLGPGRECAPHSSCITKRHARAAEAAWRALCARSNTQWRARAAAAAASCDPDGVRERGCLLVGGSSRQGLWQALLHCRPHSSPATLASRMSVTISLCTSNVAVLADRVVICIYVLEMGTAAAG